jgi:hypothetical protein
MPKDEIYQYLKKRLSNIMAQIHGDIYWTNEEFGSRVEEEDVADVAEKLIVGEVTKRFLRG